MKHILCLALGFGILIFSNPILAQSTAASDGYTLPESYYNSINQPVPEAVQTQTEVTVNPSVEEPNLEVVAQITDSETQPLPAEFNNSYILSELGTLQAEMAAMKQEIKKDQLAGYAGGFFLRSADNKFKLKITGRLQMAYTINFAEDISDYETKHSLALKTAFYGFTGNAFSEKLSFAMLMLPHISPDLIYTEINYKFNDYFALFMAYDTVMFTPFHNISGKRLMFASRSMVAKRFNVGDTLMLAATGAYKWFSYKVAIANGPNTDYNINNNTEMTYTSRFDFNIMGKLGPGEGDMAGQDKPALVLGVGAVFGHYDNPEQARLMTGTTDLRFHYKGFSFVTGAFWRQIDPDQFTRAQTDVGVIAQTSYFAIPQKLEVALRAAALFDDLTDAGVNMFMSTGNETRLGGMHAGGDVGRDSDNEYEFSLGANYYFEGFDFKVQAHYTMWIDGVAGPDDLVNHAAMVMFHLGF